MSQLHPVNSGIFSPGLEGNPWCLVLPAFAKRSASVSYCVPFLLQGSRGRGGKVWRRQELEEHLCPQGKAPAGPPFPSTHPLPPLFQFHPAPLAHEHRALKRFQGPTTTSPLGWCLTHLCSISPHRHLWTYLCLFIREHLYIYKTVTHISHVHQHTGGPCWPSLHGAHAHPAQGPLLLLAGRAHILHPHLPQDTLV